VANHRSGNIVFIDTAGVIPIKKPVTVYSIFVSSDGSSPTFQLLDPVNDKVLVSVNLEDAGNNLLLDYSKIPLYFPNGIKAGTINNTQVTLTVKEGG
jgi:hypothetical protein